MPQNKKSAKCGILASMASIQNLSRSHIEDAKKPAITAIMIQIPASGQTTPLKGSVPTALPYKPNNVCNASIPSLTGKSCLRDFSEERTKNQLQ